MYSTHDYDELLVGRSAVARKVRTEFRAGTAAGSMRRGAPITAPEENAFRRFLFTDRDLVLALATNQTSEAAA
jgi:hypothetical protein